jgi:hypothetical protein
VSALADPYAAICVEVTVSACRTHRTRPVEAVPRPLLRPEHALAVADAVLRRPEAAETVCLVVDAAYLPVTCLVVEGGGLPDDVFAIADLIAELGRQSPAAHVVLVTVRPEHPLEASDAARWSELDRRLDEGGVALLEWFVACREVVTAVTPMVGQPTRWWA